MRIAAELGLFRLLVHSLLHLLEERVFRFCTYINAVVWRCEEFRLADRDVREMEMAHRRWER